MAKVLVVDDSPVEQTLASRLLGKIRDLQVTCAGNGLQALEAIVLDSPDLVLTDLQMPEMDGLELVREIRLHHSSIPVILMTAFGSEDIALQALKHGAANYVPKKNLARDLAETVDSVLTAASDLRMTRRLLEQVERTESYFCLENDITLIAPLMNYAKDNLARIKLLDNTGLIRVSVALREAVMNAIVHGNLGVGSELRERDLGEYYQMIDSRRHEFPFSERRIHLHAIESREEVQYIIRDEGLGFDPEEVPDPTDPANMERASGRGLLLMRTFMDRIEYNGVGNEVIMSKRREQAVS